MSDRFEFATAPRIVFGAGSADRLGEHAARLGRKAWLVTGGRALESAGVLGRLRDQLTRHHVATVRQSITAEPDTSVVDQGSQAAIAAGCDFVIGIGGGSVLDAAKAIAALMANSGSAIDYLEVVGGGRTIEQPSAPFLAVPTTAGTGSEATHNAVLADPATGTKASIRHESLLPRLALLDPTLTHSQPKEVTARSGLDALIQLIEPYVSRRDHPMVDPLALEGIRRAARALPRAHTDGQDAAARSDMLLAALWSGIALAHCGLGAAHGFAGPLGGQFRIRHGFACAATMPWVMESNLRVAERSGDQRTIARYSDVAEAMGLPRGRNALDTALAGAGRMHELCRELKVPTLGSQGVSRDAIPDLVRRARLTSSMKANPVDLSDEDLAGILERAIGA